MRKFKLIKEYPESPKIGTVVKIIGASNSAKPYTTEDGKYIFAEKDLTNYPEFWEEIKEKDYEILSFINSNGQIFIKDKRGIFRTEKDDENNDFGDWRTLKHILDIATDLKICSVKRLSDGEVFSIGDKVQDSLTDALTGNKVQIINYFYYGDKLICQAESGTTMPLSTIRKAEPICTTYDNAELFGGEKAFLVMDTLGYGVLLNFSVEDFKNTKGKIFAKKENVEKYIRDNQKKYSLNDIKETVKKLGCFGTTLIEYLENENR